MAVAGEMDGSTPERRRQRTQRLVRSLGLLDLPSFAFFTHRYLRTWRDNRRFLTERPEFVPPPMWRMYEAYGHCSYRKYVESGSIDARMILSMIQNYSANLPACVLDWGCGPGRTVQPLKRLGGAQIARLYGADYNPETVAWCRRVLKGIMVDQNGLEPPFRYDAAMFDAVYCISVFTHLSEKMHFAWIDEIKRVLKPGGILIATVHGENYSSKLLADERAQYDAGELVARAKVKEGSQLYCAFHPDTFMRDRLFQGLEVLHVDPNPCPTIAQTLWVVRKPA